MKRPVLGFVTGLLAVSLIAATVPTGVDAFLQDIDERVSDLEARVSVLEDTSTTTTVSSTTTSTSPASTTTTVLPSTTTTTTPATTTTLGTTTTSTPTTTTTVATTTTTVQDTVELTSDWIITEDDTRSGFTVDGNGHAIVVDGADVTWSDFHVDNVSRIQWLNDCGVADLSDGRVTNSGVAGEAGSYPIHFHLCGDSTRGSVVDNVTIRGSEFRGFVPHGSHGVTIQNSRCEAIAGECVWWDFPGTNDPDGCGGGEVCDFIDNSNDTVIDNVVADGVEPPEGFRGFRQSAFMLGAGTGNVIRNSHAQNVEGRRDCSGFHWPEFGGGRGRGQPLTWEFENNTADNPGECHGVFVWQNDDQDHVVDGFSGDGIGHGAYVNVYRYENVDVPYVEAHAAGWSMADSHVGVFTALRHRRTTTPTVEFTNVTFDEFVINNGTNGGDIRGVYQIDGSNLTCSDITYQNVVSGTEVVIDGVEC